jgi:hypothetical protein
LSGEACRRAAMAAAAPRRGPRTGLATAKPHEREMVMNVAGAGPNPYAPPSAPTAPGVASAKPASAKSGADTAVADFMAYAKMTPAQKMRAMILGGMKLTEKDLAAMDPKERAKIEQKIKDLIQEKVARNVEKKTGVIVDMKA